MIEKICWNGILYSMFVTFGISGLSNLNTFTRQLILSMNQFAFVASCSLKMTKLFIDKLPNKEWYFE